MNTKLVTSCAHDDAGRVRDVTDPRGIVVRNEYDPLDRAISVIEYWTCPECHSVKR